MSDAWMIPNIPAMGGGGIFSTGSSGLSNAQQQYAQNQLYYAQQQAALQAAAAMTSQQQLYGAGGFGGATAQAAATGAAYGRATGGFGGGTALKPGYYYGPGGQIMQGTPAAAPAAPTQVPVEPSPFDVENAGEVPYLGTGGGDPMGGGGFSGYTPSSIPTPPTEQLPPPTVFDPGMGSNPIPASPPPGSFSPSPNYPGTGTSGGTAGPMPTQPSTTPSPVPRSAAEAGMPEWQYNQMMKSGRMGSVFDPATYAPSTSVPDRINAAPPINSTLQPPAPVPLPDIIKHGIDVPIPQAPPALPAGTPEWMINQANKAAGRVGAGFAAAPAYDPNSFANRFGAGGYYQPGTPSQYYTGSQYPGAQAPPAGYQTPFSADNPGGALPVEYYQHAFTPGGA